MTLRASLVRQLENPDLTRNGRALLRCKLARELEDRGDYEAAREVIGELWERAGERPHVEKLEAATAAEVLMRVGVLTGHLADRYQIVNAQEKAKNLITEASRIFESPENENKALEAQTELAVCYWREGNYDETRIILKEVLARLKNNDELKAKATLRIALTERATNRQHETFRILTESARLFDSIENHTLKGSYHNELANVLCNIGMVKSRDDYIDLAFVEYAAAGFHFEEARHKCYTAHVENNLGYLHYKAGRYTEAHRHLDRARHLLISLKDKGMAAQVDETRARVFLEQGDYKEAERVARAAVSTLEQGDRQALLAEALTTHGVALARLGYHEQARRVLSRSVELSQLTGAPSAEAEAELRKIEEVVGEQEQPSRYKLTEEVLRHEAKLIKEALVKSQGSITQAARLLDISHQNLCYMLETRHQDLRSLRTPIKRRRKSQFKKPRQ